MEIYGHPSIEPPTAPLPADPHKALADLRLRVTEPPFAIGIRAGSSEEAIYNATLKAVAEKYPETYTRVTNLGGRSVALLMGLLKNETDETGQSLILNRERLVSLAGAFLGEVATRPKAKDPLAAAWHHLGQPRPARTQTSKPVPREKPPTKRFLHERMVDEKLQAWLEQDSGQILSDIRRATSTGQFTLNGKVPEIHTPVIDQLSAWFEQLGHHSSYQSRTMASELIKAMHRYSRFYFASLSNIAIRGSLVLRHAQPYFEDVLQLEQAGLAKPYRRVLVQSPKEIELLRTLWVHEIGMPDWAFVKTAESNAVDIQAAMQELHLAYGTTPPRKCPPSEATIEKESLAVRTVLATEPTTLLAEMRQALLSYRIKMSGGPIMQSARGAVEALTEWLTKQNYGPKTAEQISSNYIKAMSRLIHSKTKVTNQSSMTLDLLLPHVSLYLEQAEQLRQSGLSNPYRHARCYSLSDIDGLYEYWINQKGMPDWVFNNVASENRTNLDLKLQKLYDNYGPDIPRLSWMIMPLASDQPFNSGGTYNDFLRGPEQLQPEELYLSGWQRTHDYEFLSRILGELPQDEALATIIVYDLDLSGHQAIDIPGLLKRLGISADELSTYVEQQVLPKLQSNLKPNNKGGI